MSDTPARLPQVGETWIGASGDAYELVATKERWTFWLNSKTRLGCAYELTSVVGRWTPPEPPIEWERGVSDEGLWSFPSSPHAVWRIVKREGQEPTIERVES